MSLPAAAAVVDCDRTRTLAGRALSGAEANSGRPSRRRTVILREEDGKPSMIGTAPHVARGRCEDEGVKSINVANNGGDDFPPCGAMHGPAAATARRMRSRLHDQDSVVVWGCRTNVKSLLGADT